MRMVVDFITPLHALLVNNIYMTWSSHVDLCQSYTL